MGASSSLSRWTTTFARASSPRPAAAMRSAPPVRSGPSSWRSTWLAPAETTRWMRSISGCAASRPSTCRGSSIPEAPETRRARRWGMGGSQHRREKPRRTEAIRRQFDPLRRQFGKAPGNSNEVLPDGDSIGGDPPNVRGLEQQNAVRWREESQDLLQAGKIGDRSESIGSGCGHSRLRAPTAENPGCTPTAPAVPPAAGRRGRGRAGPRGRGPPPSRAAGRWHRG